MTYLSKVRGTAFTPETLPNHRVAVTAHCSCGAAERTEFSRTVPLETLRRHFGRAGWVVSSNGNQAKCPVCAGPKRSNAPMSKANGVDLSVASANTIKAQARAFSMLGEAYDEQAGRYRPDQSDATIAKASGLSPDAIAKFRVALYGEFKADPELAKLSEDLQALRELMKSQLADFEARLAKAIKAATNV